MRYSLLLFIHVINSLFLSLPLSLFSYFKYIENNARWEAPRRPQIIRTRPDLLWEDVVFSFYRDKQYLNGTSLFFLSLQFYPPSSFYLLYSPYLLLFNFFFFNIELSQVKGVIDQPVSRTSTVGSMSPPCFFIFFFSPFILFCFIILLYLFNFN